MPGEGNILAACITDTPTKPTKPTNETEGHKKFFFCSSSESQSILTIIFS
jgi:hypothetical protein